LKKIIQEGLLQINWTEPGRSEFYESCCVAETSLTESLKTVDKTSNIPIHPVGHTHIDIA